MSPLANLLSRGKEEQDPSLTVSDLPVFTPTLARVNLLPPEIAEAERFRREQILRGAAVAGAVAVTVALFMGASNQVTQAEQDVAAAEARSSELQTQVRALSDVPRTAGELRAAQAQQVGALGQEVRWSFYLNNLGLITNDLQTQIQTMSVTQNLTGGDASAPASGATSYTGTPGIATVTYTGVAKDADDVSYFLDALAKQPGNVDPSFTNAANAVDSASGEDVVGFNATVTVTEEAYSNRYSKTGD